METQKTIIEINGVKLEVDLRTAKRIDEFKVGDNVKVLQKNGGNDYKVLPGVIIDFVNFKDLPTIQIATFENDYWGNHLRFINFNANTDGYEITLCSEHEITLEKNRVIDKFNLEISKKQAEIDDLLNKKNYLIKHFSKYFKDIEEQN